MNKKVHILINPIISTFLIYGLLILCVFIPSWISSFKFSEYKWIWSYGNRLIKAFVYLLLLWSLILPMLLWF